MRATLTTALQVLLYLTLPATVGLIVLGKPLISLLFLRGEFDSQAVDMVAWALAWYAVGLVAHSELEVVTRAFYALHDTATPVWVGGGAMALNVGLSLLLGFAFERLGLRYMAAYQAWMPLGGLALANSVATILETLTLAWLLRRRLSGLGGKQLWASLWRTAVGAAVMCAALLGFLRFVPTRSVWVLGAGGILTGAVVYAGCTLLLHSPELDLVLAAVRRRVGR